MKTFKTWGSGDIIKTQENYQGNTDYDHIESLVANDYFDHISIKRSVRNVYENEKQLFHFLNELASHTKQDGRVFENSLEHALDISTFLVNDGSGANEETTIQINWPSEIADIQNKYFTISSDDNEYYIWYDLTDGDRVSLDPGQAHAEASELTINFPNDNIAELQETYFTIPEDDVGFWFDFDDSGSQPSFGGTPPSEINEIDINSGMNENGVATAIETALGSSSINYAISVSGNIITLTYNNTGEIAPLDTGDTGFDWEIISEGLFIDSYLDSEGITANGHPVSINTSDDESNVAIKTQTVIEAITEASDTIFSVSQNASILTITYIENQKNIKNAFDGTTTFNVDTIQEGNLGNRAFLTVKPGIAFYENLFVNRPTLRIAERQLADILNLKEYSSVNERAEISYDYSTHKFSVSIYKQDGAGVLQSYDFNNGGAGYNSGVELTKAVKDDTNFQMLMTDSIHEKLETVQIEPTFVLEVGTNITKYLCLFENDLKLLDTPQGLELFEVNYDYDHTTGTFTENSRTDKRQYYKLHNVFDKDLYFNLPNEENVSGITNPLTDNTVDYSNINNENMFVSIFRSEPDGLGGFTNENAVFAYVNDDLDTLVPADQTEAPSATNDVFYFNKDVIVKTGANTFHSIGSVAASAASGFPITDTFSTLPSSATDGSLMFVRETNIFYRYSSEAGGWIYTSDPYKNHHNNVLVKAGTDSEGGDDKTFKFDSTTWRRDGGNISVYINGIFQVPNQDYTVISDKIIEFTSVLETPSESNVIVKVVEGGENYFPDRVNYISGTSQGLYDGSLTNFPTSFPLIKDRIDVFKNGILMKESTYIDTFALTANTTTMTLTFTGQTWTVDEFQNNFIFVKSSANVANVYEVRKIVSNTADTITIDSVLPEQLSIDDEVEIYENYDYLINEGYDEVILFSESVAGDFIEIRNRAAIVSNYKLMAKGTIFPSYPVFGMEFYNTDESIWYKYNGDSWMEL